MRVLLSALAIVLLASGAASATDGNPGKVLIITGDDVPVHQWRLTTPFMKKILTAAGHQVDITETPSRDLTAQNLARYDVFVLVYRDTPKGAKENPASVWSDANKQAFLDAVKGGKGLYAHHYASAAFTGKTEFDAQFEKAVGGGWRKQGYHGQMHEFMVTVRKDHPITHGIQEFHHGRDELYQNSLLVKGSVVLATAYSDKSKDPKNTGNDEPVVWVTEFGKGRVCENVLGHDLEAMQNPYFQALFIRGVEWAATGQANYPVPATGKTKAFAQPDPHFHIYLCFGQSNMEGGGKIEERDRTVDKRFQVLADFDNPKRNWKKGQWYDAVPPLTRRAKGFSLVDSFGRTMVANLPEKIRVGVVKVGIAGTKIEVWDKDSYKDYLATSPAWKVAIANEYGGNPYGYLVELAKIAQKDGMIKGILLHQGESNAEDQDWPKKVKKVYDDLITDLNLKPESVSLLAGEVVNADQGGEKASANEIMKKLPATLPNSYVISSAGLPCNSDHLHFTAEGYRQFGRRYAEKMLAILGYKVESTK